MEALSILKHFDTFTAYPLATCVHLLVGIWCGRELELARIQKNISQAVPGVVVFFGWLAYEISEFARVKDSVDVDIANGLTGVFIGIFLWRVLVIVHRFIAIRYGGNHAFRRNR